MIARRVLPLLILASASCGGDEPVRDGGPAGPVPRPACVVATISIRQVADVARALREIAGPLLPPAVERADARLWMSALADVPSEVAPSLADHGDAHLLLLDGASAPLAWALPLERSAEPSPPPAGERTRLVRAGRHLVIAPDTATLRAVAPYVERTLARRAIDHAVTATVDAEAAPKAADALLGIVETIAGELREEARAVRIQMGREPEIGEPEAVAAWIEDLGRRAALSLGDAGVQASLDLSARALTLRLALDARPDTTLARDLAASSPGPMTLAQHVPGDAALAFVVRRSPAERRTASGRTVELLRKLAGPRLAPGEAEAVGAALSRWDDASGAEGAVALVATVPSPTLLVSGDVGRPEEATAALRALAERLGQGHLAIVGQRLGLWPTPRPGRGPGVPPVQIAVVGERVTVAVGPTAADALSRTGSSLAERREVAELLRGGDGHLISLGALSPTALVAALSPLGGEHLQRVAAAARTVSSSERAAWSVAVRGRRLVLDVAAPPPELRALAAALSGPR